MCLLHSSIDVCSFNTLLETSLVFLAIEFNISATLSVDSFESSASFLTSSATTAKPLPCSPALAASIDSLSAN